MENKTVIILPIIWLDFDAYKKTNSCKIESYLNNYQILKSF
jgi:hypothetical protein